MNKKILITIIILIIIKPLIGQVVSENKLSHGLHFMAGGRYDNLRRCAATSAGTKGGPIADIMFITRYKLNEHQTLAFNLPVMRPILFGLAFRMLQFEPEFTFESKKILNEKTDLIMGPGLGVSFHYGPDYLSKLRDKENSFFAVGPILSWQTGFAFKTDGKVTSNAGLKLFYVPLFSKEKSTGTVLGGALFYSIYFK